MAINDDDFLHARGEMPSSPEPARTFSPPSSPPTSSGLAEDTSNVVAFNGAATTKRDESVIAVMRAASSTASMRSAFGQWRDVATDEAARKSLSGLAFRMEGGYSSEEDEVETARAATNAVDPTTRRGATNESPNGGFEARRVATKHYIPEYRHETQKEVYRGTPVNIDDREYGGAIFVMDRHVERAVVRPPQTSIIQTEPGIGGVSNGNGASQRPAVTVNSVGASEIRSSENSRGSSPR